MPTNKEKKSKRIFVNGKEEPPKKKTRLPLDKDWQSLVREKQELMFRKEST